MTLKALIVDDEQLARDELQYLLTSIEDVEVVAQGKNGIEAIDLVPRLEPDVVFLDVQMPGLDGFAVLRTAGRFAVPVPLAGCEARWMAEGARMAEATSCETWPFCASSRKSKPPVLPRPGMLGGLQAARVASGN